MTQIVMTANQLDDLVNNVVARVTEQSHSVTQQSHSVTQQSEAPKRYVYGLRGIRELFNVSHVTAQKYKDTFLKPAVMQRGRKIIVDVEKAMQIYNEQQLCK